MEGENTFDNIDEVLSQIPDNFKIMEETIDLEIQKDYIESTKNVVFDPETDQAEQLIEKLHNEESSVEDIKAVLVKLSLLDKVEAFRAIEAFNNCPLPELREWTLLSLQQSRMVIQSSLMDEQQVFISTGLGGKDKKLRYYLIFPYNSITELSEFQANALKSELGFFLERSEGQVEEVNVQANFATALVLLPIKTNIPDLVREVLNECNQYGSYLSSDVLITNMKRFSREEIIEILKQYEQK